MLTHGLAAGRFGSFGLAPTGSSTAAARKVVIVNGTPDVLELLEQLPGDGGYDVVFVESSGRAYSQIKRVRPHLVILCIRMREAADLQVLSMLKLDAETRDIPVLTCALELAGTDDSESADADDSALFVQRPDPLMN